VYTYHIDPAQIENVVPSFPPPPMITSVPPSPASLRAYERWRVERQTTLQEGNEHAGHGVASVLRNRSQRWSADDESQREDVPSISALQRTLWKCLREMFAHPEKSRHEISRTIARTDAAHAQLEQVLTRLYSTDLLTRASEAQDRWVGLPFTFHHEGNLWNGTIDLAFFSSHAWVVGFFAFDTAAVTPTQSMSGRNNTLPLLHAFVLERLTQRPVQEIVIVDIRSGAVTTVPWGDAERNVVAAELPQSSSFGGKGQ